MTTTSRAPRHAAARRVVAERSPRLDIQGLRAIAVVLVVVYHLWPWHLTGGYVGVDVFFVISGFLITSHLMREVHDTGSVRLAHFWARRARRLLPASMFVLAIVLFAIVLVVPQALWSHFARDIGASALYVENWLLASDSVDYLAANAAASPVQHYWSLSAEEQFYLVWPLLVLASLWFARRARERRRAVAWAVALVTAASFAVSIAWTVQAPSSAYFVTPTRAWEFGLGAVLAFVPLAAAPRAARAIAAWLGLALILASAFILDGSTPFPGAWALLPVAGTVVVLWARADDAPGSPTTVLKWRFVQATGDASYSIYLWHWPAVILAPYALGRDLLATDKLVLLVAIGVVSYGTWLVVENPVRRARLLVSGRPRLTFATAGLGMAILLGGAWAVASVAQREAQESLAESQVLLEELEAAGSSTSAEPSSAAPTPVAVGTPAQRLPCIGAAVVAPEAPCQATLAASQVVPTPSAARLDSPHECLAVKGTDEFEACEFGVPREQSRATVALVGDSHAYHWLPALERVALDNGWHGVVMTRESCPFTPADRNLDERIVRTCSDFNDSVVAEIGARGDIQVVVMAAYAGPTYVAPEGVDQWDYARDQFRKAIDDMPEHVRDVYVIRDSPKPRPDNVECVEQRLTAGDDSEAAAAACGVPRDEGLVSDVLLEAALEAERGSAIDLSELYCDDQSCYPVVGNVMVYADQGHLTRTWVRSAAPILERTMGSLLGSA